VRCSSPAKNLLRHGRRRPTPRCCAACAGDVTTAETSASAAAKLQKLLILVEGTSPRGSNCHSTVKAGNVHSVELYICRVALFLLWQRRCAADSGLGTTIKYL
jgi:hypothetical protein